MKKTKHPELADAVKKLRLALGETQEAFAKRLGTAKSTLVRYESIRPPHAKVLAQLAHIAETNKQPHLEAVFHKALAAETGDAVVPKIDFHSQEERDYTLALLAAFRNDQYQPILKDVKKLLDKPRAECDKVLHEFQVAKGFIHAAERLLDDGKSPEYVAEVLGISLEKVTRIANWRRFFSMAKRTGLMK
jgi:transcriptional regulator with XRE-family HTH domain